jgi:hypothetical protein
MVNREIMNTYENLQIVRPQFFTDKLILVYIQFIFDNKGNFKLFAITHPAYRRVSVSKIVLRALHL